MRVIWLVLVLLACALAEGCAHSGNFSSFIVQEVARYGGHTKTNAALPTLDARWTVRRDKNGFQAFVTGASFSSADAVMRQAFGTPMMSGISSGTEVGLPYNNWSARDIGVAIMVIGRTNRIEVNCVRGVQNIGEFTR